MRRRILMLVCLLALGGCAHSGMSEAECKLADWRAVGFEDGARGLGPESIGVHRTACAEHGVAPRFDDYMAGHAEGLLAYCRPEHGSVVGSTGQPYTGVCPPQLEGPFLEAHKTGFGLFERRTRLYDLQHQINTARQRSDTVERLLVEKTATMLRPDLLPASRASLAVELKQLGEERSRLADTISRLQIECDEAAAELERYRDELAQRQ